jgi:uroporphyrinogen-III decarboxylase
MKASWLNPAEPESVLWYDYSNPEGAAAQTLAILAMAGVDQLRRFGDLVADLAALAAAGLRKLHGNGSPTISHFDPMASTSIAANPCPSPLKPIKPGAMRARLARTAQVLIRLLRPSGCP